MKPQPEMVRRVAAAQKTLDAFRRRKFRWGRSDCVRMAAFHLRQLGHRVKLPPSGSYNGLRAGKAALEAAGYASLREAMDGLGFERIASAAALVGDVIEVESENELGALNVVLSNGRSVGYHPDAEGAAVLQVHEPLAAWRVPVL